MPLVIKDNNLLNKLSLQISVDEVMPKTSRFYQFILMRNCEYLKLRNLMAFYIKYSIPSNGNNYFNYEQLSSNQAEKQVYLKTHILINCALR